MWFNFATIKFDDEWILFVDKLPNNYKQGVIILEKC